MFGDKLRGLLQAFKRDLGNCFERAPSLGERLARKGGFVSRFHLAPCIRPCMRFLHTVMGQKPRLDRLAVAAVRLADEVDRERLVGLGGGVPGDALP